MQPCKTGDQPYSDASPNVECSLDRVKEKEYERDNSMASQLIRSSSLESLFGSSLSCLLPFH